MACIDECLDEYVEQIPHPYREPEEPDLASSAFGILLLKHSLDEDLLLIQNIKRVASDIGFYLAISGSFALLGSITGPEGVVLGGVVFLNYYKQAPKHIGHPYILTEFLRGLFKENLPIYQSTLQKLLLRSDIQQEDLSSVPPDYAQALLLDYARSQYNIWKEGRSIESRSELPSTSFDKSKRTRLDELSAALNRMDERHFDFFIESFSADLSTGQVFDSDCYDCLYYVRSGMYLKRNVEQINNKVVAWLDALLSSGSEKELFHSARHFADFGYWDGFYQLLGKFTDSTKYGPELVALSIRKRKNKTDFDTSNYGTYQTTLSVLFEFLVDRALFERAEGIIPLMDSKSQARYELELDFAKSKTEGLY